MGLDIYLRRIKKYSKEMENDESTYRIDLVNVDTLEYDDKGCPEWAKNLAVEIEDSYIDLEKLATEYNIDFETASWSFGEDLELWDDSHSIKLDYDDIPTFQKKIKVLAANEIGYQRKGVKNEFYDDYANCHTFYLWTKKDVIDFKNKYIENDMKAYFQTHILDKFVEGKDAVYISW